jgi:hypothetical protein
MLSTTVVKKRCIRKYKVMKDKTCTIYNRYVGSRKLTFSKINVYIYAWRHKNKKFKLETLWTHYWYPSSDW